MKVEAIFASGLTRVVLTSENVAEEHLLESLDQYAAGPLRCPSDWRLLVQPKNQYAPMSRTTATFLPVEKEPA